MRRQKRTQPLTESAEEVLIKAAQMMGEPHTDFPTWQLAGYLGEGHTVRGLKAHTLPALLRRNYIFQTKRGWWALTNEGFELAFDKTGGYGLL